MKEDDGIPVVLFFGIVLIVVGMIIAAYLFGVYTGISISDEESMVEVIASVR